MSLLWVASLPPLFVPAHFCPQKSVGGRNGRFALSGSGFAALLFPPPPPVGGRGELRRRVSRGLEIAPVGRSKAATNSFLPSRHREAVFCPHSDTRRREPRPTSSCQRGDYKGGDGQIISSL